ncbi:MAG: NrfD/PsrC family molybdoenzyme membrane anchor subunit [Anaerolineales bacterium]
MPELGPIPFWEWWVVLYFFAGGIAGGAFVIAAIVDLFGRPEDRPIARMGYLIALPLLPLCGLALILDLGEPLRFWHMLVYSKTLLPDPVWDSPISVGSYALLVFSAFSGLMFLATLGEMGVRPFRWFHDILVGPVRAIVLFLGSLSAFFLASYTGVLLAHTRYPVWADSPLMGALFLASSASTGMAAIALGLWLTRADLGEGAGWNRLKLADSLTMILEIVLLIALLAWVGSATLDFLFGRPFNAILLVGVVLIVGLLIPLALQFRSGFQGVKSTTTMTVLAALLILIGGLALRTVMVMGVQGLL